MKKAIFNNLKTALLIFFLLLSGREYSLAQCSATSSNGWTATFNVTLVSVVPTTTNCQWSYNYDIRYDLRITFTGSTTNRSVSGNIYFTCSGGNGGLPYRGLGTFTTNTTTTQTTNNNARGYNAVSSYNYGSNPSCTTIKLSDANCTSYRVDYWGTGVTNGSFNCAPSTPLPIELLYFDANYSDDKVNFRWATASETNNDYFTLERSKNGTDYEPIKYIKGAGNSSTTSYYVISDEDPPSGIAYYRLKQTDYNGDFEYSKVFVAENLKQRNSFTVIPNPANDFLSINYTCPDAGDVHLEVYDSMGKKVLSETVDCSNELNPKLNIETLPKGIYVITLSDANVQIVKTKFIKK